MSGHGSKVSVVSGDVPDEPALALIPYNGILHRSTFV